VTNNNEVVFLSWYFVCWFVCW